MFHGLLLEFFILANRELIVWVVNCCYIFPFVGFRKLENAVFFIQSRFLQTMGSKSDAQEIATHTIEIFVKISREGQCG